MKKRTLILAIMLNVVCSLPIGGGWGRAHAQTYIPFPSDSAQWSVRHLYNNSQSANSFQYKMKGDTLLNGIIYHKIYYSLDLAYDSPNQTLHCFVREDTTKKVFVKYPAGSGIDTTEFMLYNFNLVVGDTLAIRLFYFNTDSVFKLKVTAIFPFPMNSIDTPMYYRLEPLQSPAWFCTNFTNFAWREGFGSSLGPFFNEIPEWGCDDGGYEVSCFWHRGVYLWGGTFCDYTTDINETKGSNYQLYVYPNPAQSQIMLEFDLAIPISGSVEIKNILGQSVKIIDNITFSNSKNKIEIDVSEFSKGLYFMQLQSGNKIMSKKFMKQ